MTREIARIFGMVGLVALSACNMGPALPGEGEDVGVSGPGTIESDGALTLLHKEVLDSGQAVEFYEFVEEPGLILISEEGPAYTDPVLAGRAWRTVTESFRTVRPNAPIPRKIAEAQARQDRFLAMADPDSFTVERQEPGVQPMPTMSVGDNPSPTRFLDWSTMQTGHGNASGAGCDRHWFENWCDSNVWSNANDLVRFYPNKVDNNIYRNWNIRHNYNVALCSDTGEVDFRFSVRKAFSWRVRVQTTVPEGYYRWVYHYTGGNNHDYESRIRKLNSSDDVLYHFCIGARD